MKVTLFFSALLLLNFSAFAESDISCKDWRIDQWAKAPICKEWSDGVKCTDWKVDQWADMAVCSAWSNGAKCTDWRVDQWTIIPVCKTWRGGKPR